MEASPMKGTSSIWLSGKFEGSHLFTIVNYSLTKGLGIGNSIISAKFDVGGSSWQILCYPDGLNKYVTDHVSIFLNLSDGEIGTRATYSLSLVDQSGGKKDRVFLQKLPHKFEKIGSGWGWDKFIKHDELTGSNFLKDDRLDIRCVVCVVRSPNAAMINEIDANPITLPPSSMAIHFRDLLESGEGADVRFDVKGERILAHKSILAARSRVFNAQFFGPLKEEGNIKVHGIEAPIFKLMLHFIYCDELPDFEMPDLISLHKSLLAAADRYDLDRLKLLCATYLVENISIDNVTSTWVLGERHDCTQLKLYCIEFLSSLKNPEVVIRTNDFKHVKERDPSMACDFMSSLFCRK